MWSCGSREKGYLSFIPSEVPIEDALLVFCALRDAPASNMAATCSTALWFEYRMVAGCTLLAVPASCTGVTTSSIVCATGW